MCEIPLGQEAFEIDTFATTETCWSIGDNRFRLNFDIDIQTGKVILVESLSAESDIIKLT